MIFSWYIFLKSHLNIEVWASWNGLDHVWLGNYVKMFSSFFRNNNLPMLPMILSFKILPWASLWMFFSLALEKPSTFQLEKRRPKMHSDHSTVSAVFHTAELCSKCLNGLEPSWGRIDFSCEFCVIFALMNRRCEVLRSFFLHDPQCTVFLLFVVTLNPLESRI